MYSVPLGTVSNTNWLYSVYTVFHNYSLFFNWFVYFEILVNILLIYNLDQIQHSYLLSVNEFALILTNSFSIKICFKISCLSTKKMTLGFNAI